MPVSHQHQAIFVHIPKTAGTSVEAALGMHGEKHDIGLRPYFDQRVDREHLYGRDLQHLSALQLKELLGQDGIFDRYFKFCIVRNPWQRLVSVVAWSGQKWARGELLAHEEFAATVRQLHEIVSAARAGSRSVALAPHFCTQSSFILDSERRPLVDFVARYENLEQDWQVICERLGVRLDLPVRMRSHHRPYRDYFTPETRAWVAEIYAEDIRAFGYEF